MDRIMIIAAGQSEIYKKKNRESFTGKIHSNEDQSRNRLAIRFVVY